MMDTTLQIKRVLYKKTDKVIEDFIDDLATHLGDSFNNAELTEELILELYLIYKRNRLAGSTRYL